MDRLARVVGVAAALLCGAIAGRVFWSPLPADQGPASALPAMLAGAGAAIACSAVIAVAATTVLARRRSIALTTAIAVAGLGLLALPGLVRYPGDAAVLMYSDAAAAGLVLGAAAPLAARQLSAQAGLAAGMLGVFLLAEGVESTQFWSGREGWAAYTPYVEWEPAALFPVWVPLGVAVLVLTGAVLDRSTSWAARVESPVLFVFAAVPVAAYVANWFLVDSGARPTAWYVYAALATVAVAWAAWRLPGADGRILFAGMAVLAATLGGTASSSVESWALVVSAAALVAGFALGLRLPVPVAGFVVLALIAAAAVVTQEPWLVAPAIGFTFVLPAAAGYVVGSCLPTSAPATTVGLALPFTIAIPAALSAPWGSAARYADYVPTELFDWPENVPTAVALTSVAVIVVCAVGAWGLDLRSGPR